MAITGHTVTTPVTEDTATVLAKAALDGIVRLRKRLAMEQEQQVDRGDIELDDIILNTERDG